MSLVETIVTLHRDYISLTTDRERTYLRRQIAASDQQIDQLACALYGLTEEEKALVEQER